MKKKPICQKHDAAPKKEKSRLLQTCKEKKKQKNQLSILLIRHTQKNTTTTTLSKIQSFVAIPVPKLEQSLKYTWQLRHE
jgi:hypothetical protein